MSVFELPPTFVVKHTTVDGATTYVRCGGSGPVVILLHGYG